ncbi:MAG: hypothetical protein IJZ74_08645 [Clostridia bacterium]|nr:hypothetical protein [Clostridia bacterium]
MKLIPLVLGGIALAGAAVHMIRRKLDIESIPEHEEKVQPVIRGEDDDEWFQRLLNDEETEEPIPMTDAAAQVLASSRTMDPVTLCPASLVTFVMEDGRERRLSVRGEGGIHLQIGDRGLLQTQGDDFICFEKDNGEVIGAMYYIPAPSPEEE